MEEEAVTDLRRDKLYRSSDEAMIAGVCAGLADFFGFELTLTRVLVVIGTLFFPSLVFVYIVLAVLLKKKPTISAPARSYDDNIQRRIRSEPHATLSSVRHRFRSLDHRLQRLEKYVTSDRFKLDREFEGLKD